MPDPEQALHARLGGCQPRKETTGFGVTLRTLRHTDNLTLPGLAKQSGLSKGLLSRIENGEDNVTLRTLYALAKALNLPAETLVRLSLVNRT